MAAIKHNKTLQEVWNIVANDLDTGDTLVITTDIPLPRNLAMTEANPNRFLDALQDCRAIYQEETRIGAPNVPPPELTANANGFLVCTLTNNGAPGSESRGQLLIQREHSSVQ
ncbi:MAG: hypothetical protein JXB32_24750 [Deltaproteobacteria bacterium]|nr:hypothetical protein [Deltaproteobacteria bacterium]